jgi:uncharacterized protein (TIGR00251 family)
VTGGRDGGPPLPARAAAEGIVIAVRLTPKASSDEVQGVENTADGPVLKARVRAIPDKGKANQAAVVLIAEWLGEPKSRAELVAGGKSRLKHILIRGDTQALTGKLAARVAALP